MPTVADGSKLLLGRGKIYFDRWLPGTTTPTGARMVGDADKFDIVPSVQTKDRYASTKNTATKLATVNISQQHMLQIQMGEYDPENVAIALLGDTASVTQTATPVTAESLTSSVVLGRIYQTAKRLITAITVHQLPSTVLVLGTDYEVEDATMGLIRILPTSVTVTAGSGITIDYTPTAIVAPGLTKVSAGLESKIDGKLLFVGDPAQGHQWDAEFWHVRFTPNGALALITSDFADIPVQAEVLDDSVLHPAEPLYRLTQRN
jgi:hypothetical protein